MNRIIYGALLLVCAWAAIVQIPHFIDAVRRTTSTWSLVLNLSLVVVWVLLILIPIRGLRYGRVGKKLPVVVFGLLITLLVLQGLALRAN